MVGWRRLVNRKRAECRPSARRAKLVYRPLPTAQKRESERRAVVIHYVSRSVVQIAPGNFPRADFPIVPARLFGLFDVAARFAVIPTDARSQLIELVSQLQVRQYQQDYNSDQRRE